MSLIIRVLILIITVMLMGACGDTISVEDKQTFPSGQVHMLTE